MAKLQQSPGELEQTGSTEDNDNRPLTVTSSVSVRHRARLSHPDVVPSSEEKGYIAATEKGSGYDVGYKKPPRHSQFKKASLVMRMGAQKAPCRSAPSSPKP